MSIVIIIGYRGGLKKGAKLVKLMGASSMKWNVKWLCPLTLVVAIALMNATRCHAQSSPLSLAARSQKIIEKIDGGDRNAILELGNLGDQSVLVYLERLASQQDKTFGGVSCHAQMALAKLGHAHSFQEIMDEIHSVNPDIQENAIKKLLYIGGSRSIRTLAGLLSEEKWRTVEIPNTSTNTPPTPSIKYYPPLSHVAIENLSKLVRNPPTQPGVEATENVLKKWKYWWKANQAKY
jgi:hypothetical protein